MAWYNLPQINNFGTYPDPVGPYPKPDINILAPAGTAFTAPASGVISAIDTSVFYGPSITVKFDNAPNNTAQYYAFNYLSSIASGLSVGQHISAGTILGYGGGNQNNSGGTAAFAFSGGPEYGQGLGWTQNVVGSWINPSLNPTNFLNNLKGGLNYTSSNTSSGSSGNPFSFIFPNLYQILGLPSQSDLISLFERYAIVVVGITLALIGILIMFFSSEAGQKTLETGTKAAEVAAA